jgi:hypothetical protein
MSVIKGTQIDLSKITFSDVRIDNHGRKMIFVNYNGGKLVVQTPKMYAPNGVKRWRKKEATDNKDDSFEVELSFGNDTVYESVKQFHQKMNELDSLIKDQIVSHSKEWLGKQKVSMELVENAFYSPIVKIPMDKEGNVLDYPSRIRVKIDREKVGDEFTGRFLAYKKPPVQLMLFDESKNQLTMTEDNFEIIVPKGSQVTGVLELVYLTITTKISAKWKLIQGKVSSNTKNITSYAMIDSDSEDEVPAPQSPTPLEVPTTTEQDWAEFDEQKEILDFSELVIDDKPKKGRPKKSV